MQLHTVNTIVFPQPHTSGGSVPVSSVGVVHAIDAALQLLETPPVSHDISIIRQARRALGDVEKLLQTLPSTHELGAVLAALERCRTHSSARQHGRAATAVSSPPSPARIAERVLSEALVQLNTSERDTFTIHCIHDGAALSRTLPNHCYLDVTVRRTCPEIDRTPAGIWRLEGGAFDASGEHSFTTFCQTLGPDLPPDMQGRIRWQVHECVNACRCTILEWPLARHRG